MAKKNKDSVNIVGHVSSDFGSEKDMRKRAMERYHRDYGFQRGIRPGSPDRDRYDYDLFEPTDKLVEHFYGNRDVKEINMMLGKSHKFAHSRSANEGHSVYGKPGKKGHLIGKR